MPNRRLFVLRLVAAAAAVVAALGACGHSSYNPSPTVVRLDITGPINHLVPAATGQMHAEATFSDQSRSDVTNRAAWVSSNVNVLTVSSTGLLQALTVGVVQIRATFSGVSAEATVEVQSGP